MVATTLPWGITKITNHTSKKKRKEKSLEVREAGPTSERILR